MAWFVRIFLSHVNFLHKCLLWICSLIKYKGDVSHLQLQLVWQTHEQSRWYGNIRDHAWGKNYGFSTARPVHSRLLLSAQAQWQKTHTTDTAPWNQRGQTSHQVANWLCWTFSFSDELVMYSRGKRYFIWIRFLFFFLPLLTYLFLHSNSPELDSLFLSHMASAGVCFYWSIHFWGGFFIMYWFP